MELFSLCWTHITQQMTFLSLHSGLLFPDGHSMGSLCIFICAQVEDKRTGRIKLQSEAEKWVEGQKYNCFIVPCADAWVQFI